MAVSSLLTFLKLLIILCFSNIYGFNIDINIPVIKQGPANSYFGFSIAQHKINTTGKYLLLVGAPKNNNTENSEKPGALYQCAADTENRNCQLNTNTEKNLRPEGITDGQWMGSTVRSSGQGLALVCAFRYQINYNPLGRCSYLNNDLSPGREVRQCEDDGNQNEGTAYCQAGGSASVTEDEEILLGAPGAVDWTGRVSRIHVTGSIFDRTRDKSWTHSYIFHNDPTKVPAIDKNSYMGYSVISGRFAGFNQRTYVGGAPRSSSTGQVVLFRKTGGDFVYQDSDILSGEIPFSAFGTDVAAIDFDNDGYDELIVGCPLYTLMEKTEKGNMYVGGAIYVYSSKTQLTKSSPFIKIMNAMSESECDATGCIEARFGHTVSRAGDLNLDGYQDMVVGAPYESFGKGAIYIYHGSKSGLIPKYVQKITAADIHENLTTFGYALSGGLDMDSNGYPDISVGAYQSDQAVLLRTRPIVHLFPRIIVTPKKFNMSKAIGCDFDDKALVTKPKYCVQIKICLNFTAKPVYSFNTPQSIQVKVIAEKGKVKKRIYFKDSPQPDMVTYDETLIYQNKEECSKQTIYLEDNIRDISTPISVDVSYELASSSPGKRKRQARDIPDINKFPVLMIVKADGETPLTSEISQIGFVKKCDSDDICQSNTKLDMELSLIPDSELGKYTLSIGEDKTFHATITLTNIGEPAYDPNFYLVVPKEITYGGTRPVEPKGLSPPACIDITTTTMKCQHSNPFGQSVRSNARTVFILDLDASKLPVNLTKFEIKGLFNTTSVEQTPNNDEVTLTVGIVTRTNVRVIGNAMPASDVVYKGAVRGESAMISEDDIGPAINHTYTIYNDGKGTLGGADLEILWPIEKNPGNYEHGKHLLYLMQVQSMTPKKAMCILDPSMYNVLGLQTGNSVVVSNGQGPDYSLTNGRRKRETEPKPSDPPPENIKTRRPRRNVVKLGCGDGSAKCYKILCKIFRLDEQEQAKITIRARLWQSTLLEDYASVNEVQIASQARIILPKGLNIHQTKTDDDVGKAITYAVPEPKPPEKKELQWWIILVAVIGGLFLFLVLILILWKCGFFKRMKPKDYEPTYQGEIKKNKDYDNVDWNS